MCVSTAANPFNFFAGGGDSPDPGLLTIETGKAYFDIKYVTALLSYFA